MLINALRSGSSLAIISVIIADLFLVFVALPIHEWAHAIAAYKCGDNTPKLAGGLTLNPLAHIDVLGAILIVLTGFGWGKPTPVNPNNFKHPKWDNVLVSLAGPMSNLLMGWLSFFLSACFTHISSIYGTNLQMILYYVFAYAGIISSFLGVVNLLPIPMFDGFALLEAVLPENANHWIRTHSGVLSIIIFVLFIVGALSYPISWLSQFVARFFWWISNLPFGGVVAIYDPVSLMYG